MAYQEFDLLGDPIPENYGKRGRPPHTPTEEKRRIIISLLAFDWSIEKIAAALNVTPPTLRKHYFRELKFKEEARARVEAKVISKLMREVDKGNVSAIGRMFARLDRHDMHHKAAALQSTKPTKKAQPLGKKEELLQRAENVRGLFVTPDAPTQH